MDSESNSTSTHLHSSHVHFQHVAFDHLHHSLHLLSPIKSQHQAAGGDCIRQHYASCAATLHRSPGRRPLHRGAKEEVQGWRRGDGGQRRGGFFGKGANPITGSGGAPVSLATLNSHFTGFFLPLLIPSASIFAPSLDTFSPFCYRRRHSRSLSKNAGRGHAAPPAPLIRSFDRGERRCGEEGEPRGPNSPH